MDRFPSHEEVPWDETAFDSGYRSRLDGEEEGHCPLTNPWLIKSWKAGWADADASLAAEEDIPRAQQYTAEDWQRALLKLAGVWSGRVRLGEVPSEEKYNELRDAFGSTPGSLISSILKMRTKEMTVDLMIYGQHIEYEGRQLDPKKIKLIRRYPGLGYADNEDPTSS